MVSSSLIYASLTLIHHHATHLFSMLVLQLLQGSQFMLLNHVFLSLHHDWNMCISVLLSELTTTLLVGLESGICITQKQTIVQQYLHCCQKLQTIKSFVTAWVRPAH